MLYQGYTKAESDAYFSQLQPSPESGHQPLVDIWRERHPNDIGQYTYYSYRFKCREKGIGKSFFGARSVPQSTWLMVNTLAQAGDSIPSSCRNV